MRESAQVAVFVCREVVLELKSFPKRLSINTGEVLLYSLCAIFAGGG